MQGEHQANFQFDTIMPPSSPVSGHGPPLVRNVFSFFQQIISLVSDIVVYFFHVMFFTIFFLHGWGVGGHEDARG